MYLKPNSKLKANWENVYKDYGIQYKYSFLFHFIFMLLQSSVSILIICQELLQLLISEKNIEHYFRRLGEGNEKTTH